MSTSHVNLHIFKHLGIFKSIWGDAEDFSEMLEKESEIFIEFFIDIIDHLGKKFYFGFYLLIL